MPAANFARIDLDFIYPPFRDRLLEVNARLAARGHRFVATRGYASFVEQMALWTQGRMRPGKIVTHAKGGESQHNFGIAIDFVRDTDANTPQVEPSWDNKEYEPLIEELKLAGLHSGVPYKDRPHAGLNGFVDAKQLKVLCELYVNAKPSKGDARAAILTRLGAVWQYLDTHADPLPQY